VSVVRPFRATGNGQPVRMRPRTAADAEATRSPTTPPIECPTTTVPGATARSATASAAEACDGSAGVTTVPYAPSRAATASQSDGLRPSPCRHTSRRSATDP
jgi:hypothetical protein